MSRTFKALLLSSAALTTSLGAAAEADDLESRIAALEAMVSELKSELAATRAGHEEIVRVQPVAAQPEAAPPPPTY